MSEDKNRQRLRLALGMQWLKRKEMRNKTDNVWDGNAN